MKIFSKSDISELSNNAENIKGSIDDFVDSTISFLDDINSSFEERYSEIENDKEKMINKINSNHFFSIHVRERLIKQLEYIFDELEQENFNLEFSTSESDIVSNFDQDAQKFLEHNFDIDEHLKFVDNFLDEIQFRISKIEKFCDYTRPKHKFVIEKRTGVIAIKDKYHPEYINNRYLDIDINSPEVFYAQEGINDPENGWIIPDDLLQKFKVLRNKIKLLSN